MCVCNYSGFFWTVRREGDICPLDDRDDYDNCLTMPALSPVIQAQFDGYRVCGSRDGDPFETVTRPGKDGECPSGTEPCVQNASPDKTLCYPASQHAQKCPITDIDIVTPSNVNSYTSLGYSSISLNSEHILVYSTQAN